MSTDLEKRTPQTLVDPATGQVIDLAAGSDQLARYLYEIRDLESRLREAKGIVSGELYKRMDQDRAWTMRAGDYEIRGESDAPRIEWNGQRLFGVLSDLVSERIITAAAADAVLEEVKTWKVKQRGLTALRKNPELAERIDECGEEKPAERRRLSVRRKGEV